jgi:hypothetical protein
MKDVSQKLLQAVDAAEPRLRKISELESTKPILRGGWSRKQVIGHLIDSASNNHQRFVRAALQPSLTFPGYDQDGNVRVQAIQEADWKLLVELWAGYNRYLAHVLKFLARSARENRSHSVFWWQTISPIYFITWAKSALRSQAEAWQQRNDLTSELSAYATISPGFAPWALRTTKLCCTARMTVLGPPKFRPFLVVTL